MMQQNLVKVGMADLNVASDGAIIKTTGLGSCVGLTLFDPRTKVAGMAHIMLPTSSIARESKLNAAKYADTAVPELIRLLVSFGAAKQRLIAKLAGGAQMFAFSGQSDTMRIGPRNVDSCKKLLADYSIPILAEDTGGNYGRTIELECSTGMLFIRSVQYGVKEL
ncbi:chemotaxis protein CheD [Paenibacillus tarimensis]